MPPALLFDYGNTLIAFGPDQQRAQLEAMEEVFLSERMNLPAEEAVYIGDNWLADIQGAGRLGMRTVWVREHIPYERFEPAEGDLPATAEIERILDLEPLLESWETP